MVPFLDLKTQSRRLRREILAALEGVLDSAAFALGPAVADFEKAFAPYAGARYAAGVNSGTSALHLALLAAGVGPGDEVIAPAMTFIATISAIHYTGARPVLVDVEPRFYTLDPARIEAALTPAAKAIVPVHLYGQSADMEPILALAKRRGLKVIEDAAQAHGAEYRGRRCGSLGDAAAFSFYPGKNLGAYGEGGAVTTSSEEIDRTVRILRDRGQTQRYHHDLKGFNYRLEGFQGAVLGVKMRYIEEWTEGRRRAAAKYAERLRDLPAVELPAEREQGRHVYHIYAVRVRERDAVQRRLAEAGIATGIHYPIPVHLQKCFAELGYRRGAFPVAERLGDEELSLPMFPELTDSQIDEVCDGLRRAVAR